MSDNKIDYSKFDLEHYVEEFAEKDHSKSKTNEAWFRCCFHEENTASLKVYNKQTWYCHGACGEGGGILDFVKKINNIDTKDALKIISDRSGQEVVYVEVDEEKVPFYQPSKFEAVYSYNNGNVLKYRLPNKMFTWGHYDSEDSMWYKGSGKDFITLYKPKGLSDVIILAEGEKDADTLASLGFTAVSAPHGTGKWLDEYTKELKDVDKVMIISDNDDAGKMGSEAVQYFLMKDGIDAKIINSTDLIESDIKGFDVTDAYELLGDELKGIIQEHLDSDELWNVRWNDETGEVIDVEIKDEPLDVEIVWQSGLGEGFDKFIMRAVDEKIEHGDMLLPTQQEINVWQKELGITKTAINKTINDQYDLQKPKFEDKEIESKVMELTEIGTNLDITGSGYAIMDGAGKIINEYEQEVIGHFLGFAGIVVDAEAEQDDNVKVALAYNTPQNINKMNLIVVPKKSISSGTEIVKALSGYNINVTSANANEVVKYLQDSQNFFSENTRIMKTLNRFGWYKGKLMPYEVEDTDIIFDPTHVQPIANKLNNKVGSREKSLELIQEIAVYSEANATILGAAVGSLVLSFMNDGGNQSFALNVWNETSTGKSVTCQGVASIFGYPFKDGGWWGDGNATHNADINHNALLGNLPNFIDDPARNRGLNSDDKRNYVFAVTSGEGRGRMMRDGVTKQKTREWCNVMIMTNETPFIDENIADGGARARCLEICFDKVLETHTVERWIELMTHNHGHFGIEIANKIRELGKRYFEEQLKVYVRWFNNRGVDGKRAVNASIIQLGIDVIKQTLGINVIANEEWLVKEIRGSGSLSDGERAYYKLMSIMEVSINRYRRIYDRDGIVIGSLGFDRPRNVGTKVINLPYQTIQKYAKEHNFLESSLLSWGYANNKMVNNYDENGNPKPVKVRNQTMELDVIQIYYDWDGDQIDGSDDVGLTMASAFEVVDLFEGTEVIDIV